MDHDGPRVDIARLAKTRHTCKAFDPARKISDADLAALCTVLRYAPSSVNSQPWHFVVAGSDAGKARIAEATQGVYTYNGAKLRDASHAIVLCARLDLDDAHLAALLDREDRDGRYATPEAKANQDKSRRYYVDLHRDRLQDTPAWLERQVYIALGMLLQGAAALGIDACPIEGFDRTVLDDTLGLAERGLTAVVLAAIGYRSDADFNAQLPKSRLDEAVVFTHL